MPLKIKLCTALIVLSVGASLSAEVIPQPLSGDPLPSLTPSELDRFLKGRAAFEKQFTEAEGLGPIFNQRSCSTCHTAAGTGGGGHGTFALVKRFGFDPDTNTEGDFDPLTELGGPLLQDSENDWVNCNEEIPPEANVQTHRLTTPTFGLGLVEALADSDLVDLSASQSATVKGQVHWVIPLEDSLELPRVGRFGWKSQQATALSFSADAALNEMGITNRILDTETAPNGNLNTLAQCDSIADPEDAPDSDGVEFIDRVTDFMRFLAPPPQTPRSGMTGETIFHNIGCAECHVSTMTTPNDPGLEPALRNQTFKPYSDFLLHNMGSQSDGIADGAATESYIRTAPLWGVSRRSELWHDGSGFSADFTSTILKHEGDALNSANQFAALSSTDQQLLFDFLNSLGRREFDFDNHGLLSYWGDFKPFKDCFDAGGFVSPDDTCAIADVDQDNDVDMDDFDVFVTLFDSAVKDCNCNGTPDMAEILLGAPADSSGNLDECGTYTDCNYNGTPDSCDIAAGTSEDCDYNHIPDDCEEDCDGNGINDACESDCNGNGIIDTCDHETFVANSGLMTPFSTTSPKTFTVTAPPVADSAARITVKVVADVDEYLTEHIDLIVNGAYEKSLFFYFDGEPCPNTSETYVTVESPIINATVGGELVIDLVPTSGVGSCLGSYAQVTVEYESSELDCNDNLIPDECEVDGNNNDIPDDCEHVCQADLGFAGPGSATLSVCGQPLSSGNQADLTLTGAPPLAAVWLVIGNSQTPMPFADGMVVPGPPQPLGPYYTDESGILNIDGITGGGGPTTIYCQAVVADAAQSKGFAITNAIVVELLP